MDDRGRVHYADIILVFGTLVSFIAVAPFVYAGIDMATAVTDPLSATLLQLTLPLLVIAMIIGVGVSARNR